MEEQFYLFWPLLLMVVVSLAWGWSRTRRSEGSPRPAPRVSAGVAALALVAAASCALSVRLTEVSQPWAFFSLPTRAWELAAGGLVALGAGGMRRLPARPAAVVGWVGLSLSQ